eukprot:TRINITY_DN4254_c0_g1_i1.p1 TRINITY_DN4254_c0_g1~~TRINITY_DN4254_c0_g1_i1.p1  ORF type:complete len:195 (+),score=27.25 TRINITY_DN4254_c0_g1_i1:41-625(+)
MHFIARVEVLVALFLVGCNVLVAQECSTYTDCATCTAAGCGFCRYDLGSNFCANGTSAGPTGQTCQGNDYSWYLGTNSCPDPCTSSYGECGECISNGCGYCWSANQCISVSRKGSCADFRLPGGNCNPKRNCDQLYNCEDCASNAVPCEWCGAQVGACQGVGAACSTGEPIGDYDKCPVSSSSTSSLASFLSSL